MRHGETYASRLETPMAGPDEDPELPLTPRGRTRLAAVAEALAASGLDAACSSPYRRSRETAGIVVEPLGLPVTPLPALGELPLHPPPGGTLRDVARRYLALARELASRDAATVVLDDGRDVADTVATALDAVRDALEGAHTQLLVVAHGGLNRFLLAHWLGLPPSGFLSIDQDFGCVNVIDFVRGGRAWVRAVNVTLDDPVKSAGAPGRLEREA